MSKTIHLFDFDETLMVTPAQLYLTDSRHKKMCELNTEEEVKYNTLINKLGIKRNYTEYGDNSKISLKRILEGCYIKYMVKKFNKIAKKGNVGIVTARSMRESPYLHEFFKGNSKFKHIKIKQNYIQATGGSKEYEHARKELKKIPDVAKVLKHFGIDVNSDSIAIKKNISVLWFIMVEGYDKVYFYDDNKKNIEYMKALSAKLPKIMKALGYPIKVKIETELVSASRIKKTKSKCKALSKRNKKYLIEKKNSKCNKFIKSKKKKL